MMARIYRRKTGQVRQAERRFTITDDRPARFDHQALTDLVLYMSIRLADPDNDLLTRRIAPAGRPQTV